MCLCTSTAGCHHPRRMPCIQSHGILALSSLARDIKTPCYKEQGNYGDSLLEKWLIDQEQFTADQAKAGLELYYQEHGLGSPKVLEYYGTTTVGYIDTVIRTLDNGDHEIVSRFNFLVRFFPGLKSRMCPSTTRAYRLILIFRRCWSWRAF